MRLHPIKVLLAAVVAFGAFLVIDDTAPPSRQPTAWASYQKPSMSVGQVTSTLHAAGLPMRSTPDAATTPPPPAPSQGAAAFVDERVNGGVVGVPDPGSVDLGGVVEVYGTPEQAVRRAKELQRRANAVPTRGERTFVAGTTLLRLSRYLSPAAIRGYRDALGAREVTVAKPTPQVQA